jgi:hypothetical protein
MVVWIHVGSVKLIRQKLVAWYENFQVAVGVANWLRNKVGTEFKKNWEEEKNKVDDCTVKLSNILRIWWTIFLIITFPSSSCFCVGHWTGRIKYDDNETGNVSFLRPLLFFRSSHQSTCMWIAVMESPTEICSFLLCLHTTKTWNH